MRQGISRFPTVSETEPTPLRYLDPEPDTATTPADPESAQDSWLQEDPWSRRSGAQSSISSTESEKHCTQDLREQADRSTTSALVAVQAPCGAMTPVAPPLRVSSEANAIVAAIDGALAPRLDGIQGQMEMLAGQRTSLKSEVVQLGAEVQHHDQRMSEFERQLKDITAGRCTGSGTSAASSEPHPEPARGSGTIHPPKHQRTVLVVGGFPYDAKRDVICDKLRDILTRARSPGLVDTG